MSELSLPLPTTASLRPARLCTDAQLAQRAARGDRRAFEQIFERHHQAVYRYCRSILGNGEDAADALQNTMTSVLRSLEGETREIALKAWIFRIAHNEALSIVRRRRPQVELDDAQACPRPSLESDVLASERLRQLVADVHTLPERQRGALVMRELNDLDYGEIAAVFGVSEGAARQTVHEARTALHDLEQGRSMPCAEIRELIGERDGRLLSGRKVRAHLRACSSCEGFRTAIGERRSAFGLAAPPLAAPFAGSILHAVLGSGGSGGAGALAGASGAGAMTAASAAPLASTAVATGIVTKVAAVSGVAKAVAALAAAATLTGGAVVAEHKLSPDRGATSSVLSGAPLGTQPASNPAAGATLGTSADGAAAGAAQNSKAAKARAAKAAKARATKAARARAKGASRAAAASGAGKSSTAAKRAAKRAASGRKAKATSAPGAKSAKPATAGTNAPASGSAARGRPTPPAAPKAPKVLPKVSQSAGSPGVQPKVPKAQDPAKLPGG